MTEYTSVVGARQNDLRHVSVPVPKRRITALPWGSDEKVALRGPGRKAVNTEFEGVEARFDRSCTR